MLLGYRICALDDRTAKLCRVKMYYKIDGKYPAIEQVFSDFDKAMEFSKQCDCAFLEIYDINENLVHVRPEQLTTEEITIAIHKSILDWLKQKLYKKH